MNALLSEIFASKTVHDADGKSYPLHSNTSLEQCQFIDSIIRELKPRVGLEIGLAYGISALQILQSMKNSSSDFQHIVIDPFQNEWKSIGLLNIERAGFTNCVTFYPKTSDSVLPHLFDKQTKIDFAYIDSTKVFDVLVVDVYFLQKMMNIGGVVVFDDCDYPGIRLLTRFMVKHPSFKILKTFNKDSETVRSKVGETITSALLKSVPFLKRKRKLINPSSDKSLGVNYKCIAFQKVKEDDRKWDWFSNF